MYCKPFSLINFIGFLFSLIAFLSHMLGAEVCVSDSHLLSCTSCDAGSCYDRSFSQWFSEPGA